jgi:hypothetical protein
VKPLRVSSTAIRCFAGFVYDLALKKEGDFVSETPPRRKQRELPGACAESIICTRFSGV